MAAAAAAAAAAVFTVLLLAASLLLLLLRPPIRTRLFPTLSVATRSDALAFAGMSLSGSRASASRHQLCAAHRMLSDFHVFIADRLLESRDRAKEEVATQTYTVQVYNGTTYHGTRYQWCYGIHTINATRFCHEHYYVTVIEIV